MSFLMILNTELRGGTLVCAQIITEAEKATVEYAMANELKLSFGEVNGKHSDVQIGLEKAEPDISFHPIETEHDEVAIRKYGLDCFGNVDALCTVQEAVCMHYASENDIIDEFGFVEFAMYDISSPDSLSLEDLPEIAEAWNKHQSAA